MYNYDISVVIPCLDEEKTLGICIDKCLNMFKSLNIKGEIVISDNGSKDKSIEIAEEKGAKVYHCENKGYGFALRNGFANTQGKYVLMADGDDSYNFNQLGDFYKKIIEGYDLVIGTRLKGNIHKEAMPFLHRYLGTPTLTLLTNIFWKLKLSDSQCGMRIFKKESLDKLTLECGGMEFATEVLIKAARANWKLAEIPIEYFKDGRDRGPHLRPLRDGLRHLRLIFKSKIEDLYTRFNKKLINNGI